MVKLILLIFLVASFMAINFIIGCYVAIRLGYGPPNWQTALNLVVPLTTFQRWLNEGRNWLEEKAPKVEQLLQRLKVPRPIIFVDISATEEGEEEGEENGNEVPVEQTEESSVAPAEDMPEEEAPVVEVPVAEVPKEAEPPVSDNAAIPTTEESQT